jgi:hypothetical protein
MEGIISLGHKGIIIGTFERGMSLKVEDYQLPPVEGERINLGAGSQHINGVTPLDKPEWEAPLLPYGDETVAAVHAYHFLEHLDFDMLLAQLREIERVLMYEGVFNYVVPFWNSQLAHQDLDHKTFWAETTFENLFRNPYYRDRQDGAWQFEIKPQIIMGVADRNLVVVGQLVKL